MFGKNKKKKFSDSGIDKKVLEHYVKEVPFLAMKNDGWVGFDAFTFDEAIKRADVNRNVKYAFHHSIFDMNKENLRLYIGDMSKIPTFGHMFKLLMHDAQVTVEELSELTGISEKAIQRIRNNDTDRVNLNYLIAVALALHMPYEDSIRLINTAGYCLREHNELEVIYDLILKNASDLDYVGVNNRVINCNVILGMLGYPPLTKTE